MKRFFKHFGFSLFGFRFSVSVSRCPRYKDYVPTVRDLRSAQALQDFYDRVVNAPNPFERLKSESDD